MKRLVLFIITSVFFLVAALPIYASENFDTDLDTTYTVFENGQTRIRHDFTITNKKPLFTVSQYALKISSPEISNVIVTENEKELPAEVVTTDNVTSIGITFPDKLVGQNKKRSFSISYTDAHAALISGQVLEIAVPRLQDVTIYNKYTVTLLTPARYGLPTRVTPETYETTIIGSNVKTHFKEKPGDGVSAIFGDTQVFDLTLRYNLENPNSSVRLTQIALPPDTTYQKMYYHSLDPEPEAVELDSDGNWIATYRLPASSVTTVIATAQAEVTLDPQPNFPTRLPTESLIKGGQYWEINSDVVKKTAAKLNSPKEIYDYITTTFDYDYDLLGEGIIRLGAETALLNPSQVLCQEFTDAFIALARTKGIAARRMTGYAHTENSSLRPLSFVEDVLHAWPEYYNTNENRWQPIDPTWGNTTGGINYFDQFDLNHVVFAINGQSSQTPYPAGSYKQANQESKDVEVTFGDQFTEPEINLSFFSKSRQLGGVPIPGFTTLAIKNESGIAFYNQTITLVPSDQNITITPDDQLQLTDLLPYSTVELPIRAIITNSLIPTDAEILISYGNQTTQITIKAYPDYWQYLNNPVFLIGLGVSVTVIALATGSVLVLRQRQNRTVRGESKKS